MDVADMLVSLKYFYSLYFYKIFIKSGYNWHGGFWEHVWNLRIWETWIKKWPWNLALRNIQVLIQWLYIHYMLKPSKSMKFQTFGIQKSKQNQIWPFLKESRSWTIMVVLKYPLLQTKFQGSRLSGFGD